MERALTRAETVLSIEESGIWERDKVLDIFVGQMAVNTAGTSTMTKDMALGDYWLLMAIYTKGCGSVGEEWV